MLNLSNIEKISKTERIAPLNIIREYLEMEVLYYISQSRLAKEIIFYGGTALRLAYHGPRFSEDLDFIFTHPPTPKAETDLGHALTMVVQNNIGVQLEEVIMKRWTLFGLLHITHDALKHPMRLKIEITKRREQIRSQPVLLTSPTTNKEVIFRCADLETLATLKEKAIRQRSAPRDWFDYWYLCNKLNKEPHQIRSFPFQKRNFSNELKRWLPQNQWSIIPSIITFYET